MSKKSQRTILREQSCRIAIQNALAERKKLAATVEADGDVFVRPFLTLEEHSRIVRKMCEDHKAELERTILHFMCPDPAYSRIAKLAMQIKRAEHQARRDSLHVITNKPKED